VFAAVLLLLAALAAYLAPALVAAGRGHPDTLAIGVVNLAFGWTMLGWVVALAWACTGRRNRA